MKRAKKTKPRPQWPPVPILRYWESGGRNETVGGLGDRVWQIQDLRNAVKDCEVFDVPLGFLDLAAHYFSTEEGLIGFASHMKHVMESDLNEPIIMDQWGRILDGRHRLVKALIEGRRTVKAVKIPDGTDCTYRKA